MIPGAPLLDAVAALGDATIPDDTVGLAPPVGATSDVDALRFRLFAGMFDLLAGKTLEEIPDNVAREAVLRAALTTIGSTEPALRYALHDRSSRAEQLELVVRMRGRQIAMSDRWLIPRLEEEIPLYEDRVSALNRAIEGARR